MARFQPRMHPVRSVKHVVDTNGGITGGTPSITDVLRTVDDPRATGSPNEVGVGSTVHGMFLNVQIIQKVAASGVDNIYMIVYKDVAGATLQPAVDSVGTSNLRRFVLHQEMIMTGNVLTAAAAIPKTLFKGFIAFPKTFKRGAIDDRMQVVIGHRAGEVTQQSNFCLQAIFKEFR